jgi:hypothetical protein
VQTDQRELATRCCWLSFVSVDCAKITFRQRPRQARVLAYYLDWYYNLMQRSYLFYKDEEEKPVNG